MLDGFVHPAYRPLANTLEKQLRGRGGGAAVAIYQDGECVADLWGGVKDGSGKRWERDTLSVSFSTTKGVASTALHILADRGKLAYEDRVADHWPEFAQNGKRDITIRELMSHRAGLHRLREIVDHADRLLDWEHMTEALAAAKPAPRSTRSAYHGLTYGHLVGEVIRRVSGRPFSRFIKEEIAEPLGLDGLYCGAPRPALSRAARLVRSHHVARDQSIGRNKRLRAPNPIRWAVRKTGVVEELAKALLPRGISRFDFSSDRVLSACIPAANGLFTARSLARLYGALSQGGQIDGVRLLSERTLRAATRVQVRERDQVLLMPLYWRLGYHTAGTLAGVPLGAFGHFGYGGSGAWADPKRRLGVALTVNSGMGTPLADMRILQIGAVALACADRLAGRRRRLWSPRRLMAMSLTV